jgi:hypothetical protein
MIRKTKKDRKYSKKDVKRILTTRRQKRDRSQQEVKIAGRIGRTQSLKGDKTIDRLVGQRLEYFSSNHCEKISFNWLQLTCGVLTP